MTLVEIAGFKVIRGGNNIASGAVDRNDSNVSKIVEKIQQGGFAHVNAGVLDASSISPFSMERDAYAAMFGPTTGDLVRLGDTELWIKVEKDFTVYGDECKFGGGKTLREGMGQASGRSDDECLDLLVTNALVVDWSGIYKVTKILRKISCQNVAVLLIEFSKNKLGRYWNQTWSHRWYWQGWKSRCDGRRRPQHGGWFKHRCSRG